MPSFARSWHTCKCIVHVPATMCIHIRDMKFLWEFALVARLFIPFASINGRGTQKVAHYCICYNSLRKFYEESADTLNGHSRIVSWYPGSPCDAGGTQSPVGISIVSESWRRTWYVID